MKQTNLKNLAFSILLLTVFSAGQVFAQTPKRLGPGSADEIKRAFLFVEANMDSLEAHRAYIYAKGMSNPDLIIQYEEWRKNFQKM